MVRTCETKSIQSWKLGYIIRRINRCRKIDVISDKESGKTKMMQAIKSPDTRLMNLDKRKSQLRKGFCFAFVFHRKTAKRIQSNLFLIQP